MNEIVFIADDFGICTAANAAIAHAHVHGTLTGTALMVGQPATSDAVARARDLPGLEVGWHAHLADSMPCTRRRWPWGRSPAAAGLALAGSPRLRRAARSELEAQWAAFEATGLHCRFVSAHHHLHLHPVVRELLLAILPERFAGWIRWGEPRFFGRSPTRAFHTALHRCLQAPSRSRWPFRSSDTLWGLDRTFAMRAGEIAAALPSLGEGLHEFMFHPREIGDADTRCLVELRESET